MKAFLRIARRTWRAWAHALPIYIVLGVAAGFAFAPLAYAPLGTPKGGLSSDAALRLGALFLISGLIWTVSGQSVRDDFQPFGHPKRWFGLAWRAVLGITAFLIIAGSPVFRQGIPATGSFGVIAAVGAMGFGAFVLLDWAARLGDRPEKPTVDPQKALWRNAISVLWWDVKRLWGRLRIIWKRVPSMLAAMAAGLFVLSLAAVPTSVLASLLWPTMPIAVGIVVATSSLAILPTWAAAVLVDERNTGGPLEPKGPSAM